MKQSEIVNNSIWFSAQHPVKQVQIGSRESQKLVISRFHWVTWDFSTTAHELLYRFFWLRFGTSTLKRVGSTSLRTSSRCLQASFPFRSTVSIMHRTLFALLFVSNVPDSISSSIIIWRSRSLSTILFKPSADTLSINSERISCSLSSSFLVLWCALSSGETRSFSGTNTKKRLKYDFSWTFIKYPCSRHLYNHFCCCSGTFTITTPGFISILVLDYQSHNLQVCSQENLKRWIVIRSTLVPKLCVLKTNKNLWF